MRLQAPKLATALAILRGIQLASTLLVVALCAALIHQVNTNFDPGYTSLYWGLVLAFALLGMIFAVLGQVSQMYPEKKALRISVIVADVILGLIFVLAGGSTAWLYEGCYTGYFATLCGTANATAAFLLIAFAVCFAALTVDCIARRTRQKETNIRLNALRTEDLSRGV